MCDVRVVTEESSTRTGIVNHCSTEPVLQVVSASHVHHVIKIDNEKRKPCDFPDCNEVITVSSIERHCTTEHGYPRCLGCSRLVSGVYNWQAHVCSCISKRCPLAWCREKLTRFNGKEHLLKHTIILNNSTHSIPPKSGR